MMAKRVLAVLLLATFAVASLAQFNCDQARGLGNPSSNQCSRLCNIVAQRNPQLARLVPYCNTQCSACVRDVYKCKLGAKQPLPATCQAATKFPQVLSVINECLSLRSQGKAC
jgi:hypothetical protein